MPPVRAADAAARVSRRPASGGHSASRSSPCGRVAGRWPAQPARGSPRALAIGIDAGEINGPVWSVSDRGRLRSSRADSGPQVLPPARATVPTWPHASTMIQWRRDEPADWFASADADCNKCLQNMTSGKCQKTSDTAHRIARTIIHRHGNQNAGRHHDGADLPADGADCGGQGSA